ncbi:MAG: hypothetical protein QOJ23_4063, partial [Actinomycetota bacterium]|nr:hypothetical protein [Actinomycetota bacterium]
MHRLRLLAAAISAVVLSVALPVGSLPASAAPAATSLGGASYQSTDCYHSFWGDPGSDAAELDASTYGAFYDCSQAAWTFPVSTSGAWPDSELDVFNIWIDSDGSPSSGCAGFEWRLQGSYLAGNGLRASLIRTPSCAQNAWSFVSSAQITRADTSSVAVRVLNASIGAPQAIRWYGYIKGIAETAGDYVPDSPGYHLESGFSSGACPAVPFDARNSGSYVVAGNPTVASTALESVGMSQVQSHGEGVVSFVGDPIAATKALALVGVNGPVTTDRVVGKYAETPNDPGYSAQWALPAVNAPAAWSHLHGSSRIVVADIDSGVDATHPDLAGRLLPGFNAATGAALPAGNSDTEGHGTATAGVIGAATNNGIGLASLGVDTMILPIKDGSSRPLASADVAGVRYAADHGARVINISSGGPCQDPNYAAAISYAQSKGVLIVASAGNDAFTGDHVNYPAAYPGVLAIGA